jgi:hypothetical protein
MSKVVKKRVKELKVFKDKVVQEFEEVKAFKALKNHEVKEPFTCGCPEACTENHFYCRCGDPTHIALHMP